VFQATSAGRVLRALEQGVPRAPAGAQQSYESIKREREIRQNQFRRESRFEPVVRDPLDSCTALLRRWGCPRQDHWNRQQASHSRKTGVRYREPRFLDITSWIFK